MGNLDSGAFLDCLLNYASVASVAVKSATITQADLNPAAAETVEHTVWTLRIAFDDSEAAEREKERKGEVEKW